MGGDGAGARWGGGQVGGVVEMNGTGRGWVVELWKVIGRGGWRAAAGGWGLRSSAPAQRTRLRSRRVRLWGVASLEVRCTGPRRGYESI